MAQNSEVLALKYRPRRFEELIGQESISQTLSLALDSKRLSHAYLFSGLRGSGKTSTARIFAKSLICENGPTSAPCDVCSHCVMANEGRHIDIIEMDAASSRKIDDIRDLIEHTKYRPASGNFKIFIIDEVHMLTKEAHNALLKTLEEPPEYVKFILATTDPLKLPPTILSRTQHFRFKRISHPNIVHHLSHILHLENIEYQAEALDILARSGSGSLRDTLTLMDQAIIYSKGFVDVKTVADMLGLLDPDYISRLFDAIFAKDRPSLIQMLQELEAYESEMVVDELIAYLKERLYEGDHRFSPLVIERFFRILSDAKTLFAINADGGFVVSLILFKMIEALKIKEIDEMIESLESRISHVPTKTSPPAAASVSETPSIHVTPTPPAVKSSFEQLCERISDRSSELGISFKNNVTFLSFENETLTWESCAEGEDKELLKNSFGIIRQFVREIYGIDTQIKSQGCTKSAEEPTPPNTEIVLPEEESIPEPASMVEDAEIGVGSCVSACDETSVKEFDGSDVLKEPMIQKAAELFEATKITVQSKV
ncbi:MAG: DNA polymerase III subunit gamma/tau [Sulfuricurvum sp. GWF2_44_89]|uniref:DNA polymerase III subunit gamma/tau n=1 Tax=Sulfuricurvum kujiense TaxID=148813 RepID=A0A2D3WBP2_9BACT|nr:MULTISPECIES: DNA polymerase III subunit gamma/tau [Sulfuricurvum]OHD78948.1 MAG: DNA polymerase III subunit gamma/tau [Sulfuricurvum sp. GWF2_44_89]OHD91530.1 MAG: DNA polymerase III subunit gamma/tau [Sulfuricurvum sp. RIFOXYD12_FULL_44_77]OHD91703.1 MAG: DNA polymerase III subunit gamma/tau [Sulfuricurvum sp. RIFOXYD2_FULL_44_160]DAB37838.1 MAG TPA: DNA polymerase III subunit gamma/tau [Sulfuricurvum kujiense]